MNNNTQKSFVGVLLDVSSDDHGVVLKVRTKEDNQVVQIKSNYRPKFFAIPLNKRLKIELWRARKIIETHPNIIKAEFGLRNILEIDIELVLGIY